MKKNKVFAGYINLKPINGVIFPSYAQNQMNKKYIIEKLDGEFFLSTNENTYGTNNIVLKSLLEEKRIKGICMLSTFHLPENFDDRYLIYKLAKKNKKEIHFVFEETSILNLKNVEYIEQLLIFNQSFFTKKIDKLDNFQKKYFLNKDWTFV